MSSNAIIKAAIVLIGILAVLYILSNPDEVAALFDDKPDVRFFDGPSISENIILKDFKSIISVTARNYDSKDVSNIEARLSVVKGGSWQEHLEFSPVTKLASSLSPGETTDKVNIPIKAKKLSGIETPFTLKLEIYADGESVAKHIFDIKIR